MKYAVMNHHNFWQRGKGNSSMADAEVLFMWNDFCFTSQVQALKAIGKKVIVWEHGFGAFNDYSKLNNHEPLADGYIANGEVTAGYVPNCLVAGNPVWDDLYEKKEKTGKALYVGLHWVRDVTEYNTKNYKELKETYDEYEWNIKTSDKATSGIDSDEAWYSGVEGVRSLPKIKSKLRQYDAVFTPKAGTFDSFARLMGIPVYVIDKDKSYFQEGDPVGFDIENDNYLEVGEKLNRRQIDMTKYIKRPSLSLDKILEWVKTL